ncbi:MAG: hypothetical protein Q9191_000027 [Dirinaria sp. TL-2023a]
MAPLRRSSRTTTSTTTTTLTPSQSTSSADWQPELPSTDEPPPPAWYPNLDLFTLYHLRQTSPTTQTLVPAQRLSSLPSYACTTSTTEPTVRPDNDCTLPTYTIKSNASARFMNRKPDMLLTRHDLSIETDTSNHTSNEPSTKTASTTVAEVRFDRVSSRTFLTFPSHGPKSSSEMDVESSLTQKHLLLIDGSVCMWQPTDPDSKRCLELRSRDEGLMACWTYANEPNRWGHAKEDAAGEVGVLQVSDRLFGCGADDGQLEREGEGDEEGIRGENEKVLEQVLCSAVVLVERIKRRSASLGLVGKQQTGNGLGQM